MQVNNHGVAVCSWSLRPENAEDLIRRVRSLGLNHVQIALAPMIDLDEPSRDRQLQTLVDSGLSFTGGMISFTGENYASIDEIRRTGGFVPDALWPARRQLVSDALHVAKALRLTSITTHVGFVPSPGEPGYEVMVARVREAGAILAASGIRLLMETGQESAEELLEFIEKLGSPEASINFDPANMILYGAGDPIAAVGTLGRWIRHVHVKDAIASASPGKQWGTEVPFGTGEVGAERFLAALQAAGYHGPLAIEREAGNQREQDVRTAIAALRQASLQAHGQHG